MKNVKHFIIAGMQRSGTTWLYRALNQHPLICMAKPVRPEPRFFLRDDIDDITYAAYRDCFSPDNPEVIWLGEKSTSYSEFGDLPARIVSFLSGADDVRVIFLLRDPVERAISNIKFNRKNGFVQGSVEEIMFARLKGKALRLGNAAEGASVDPMAFLERGLYWNQIEPYLTVFGKEKVKVLLSEQTLGQEAAVLDIFDWLGLPSDVSLVGLTERVNQSESSQSNSDDSLSSEMISALCAYYGPNCDKLSEKLALNLDVWNTCRL
jgi:hypothetical protein